MSLFPSNTALGYLRMLEVYDYHDGPKLFACANNAEQFFFVYWYDQTELFEQWLYVPVSVARLANIRQGEVSLRTAILEPEDGVLYSVEISKTGSTCSLLRPSDIDPETLPDPDDRLNLDPVPVETKPIALRVHESRRRLTFDLKLDPRSYRLHELDSRSSANVLLQAQELINALAQGKRGEITTRGRIAPKIIRESQVALTATRPGSFIFELAATETDLFGESLVEECLLELLDLLVTGADKATLRDRLRTLGQRVATKFKAFLQWTARVGGDLTLSWASARGADYDRTVRVPFPTLVAMARVMEEVERELAPEEVILGTLIAYDSLKLKFTLRDDEGRVYKGTVTERAVESKVDVVIGRRYQATLAIVYEVEAVSGRDRRYHYLTALTPLK